MPSTFLLLESSLWQPSLSVVSWSWQCKAVAGLFARFLCAARHCTPLQGAGHIALARLGSLGISCSHGVSIVGHAAVAQRRLGSANLALDCIACRCIVGLALLVHQSICLSYICACMHYLLCTVCSALAGLWEAAMYLIVEVCWGRRREICICAVCTMVCCSHTVVVGQYLG